MPKKIDYASMYTKRADGRYMGYYRDNAGRHAVYDRDPERLHEKILEAERPKELTFGEVAEAWWMGHAESLSKGTQAAYKAPFELVVDTHGGYALDAVTPAEIDSMMLCEKTQGMSYKHAACVRSMYKQIFDWAIGKMGHKGMNPANSIKVPRGLKRTTREAPEDDAIKIIQSSADKPFGLFPLFLLYTGFRVGEALGVKWEDIDFKAKTVTCRRSIERRFGKPYESEVKTDAGYRSVPLLKDLERHLIKPEDASPTDYVFNNDGRLYTNSEFRAKWTEWSKAVGLAELVETTIKGKDGKPKRKTYYRGTLTRHQLRHGYATICYEAGIDELTCMELMGHANVEMVRRIYTHLRQKQKGKAAGLLNAKFEEIRSGNVVIGVVKGENHPENTRV